MKKIISLLLTSLLYMTSFNSIAHHSLAVEFDSTSLVIVEGVVNEVWYKNPHVRYYMTVTNENGEEVNWDTHAHNIVGMSRQGYTKDSVKVGDRVIMEGHGTRNGSPKLFIRAWTLPDGVRQAVGNANIDRF
jgi:hypothetical protein